jgi:LEA14-like dessication related protein
MTAGCAAIMPHLKAPSADFKDMRIQDMGLFDSTLVFTYEVRNPNPVGAYLSRLNYRLFLNDKEFAAGNLDKGISLPPSGSAPVEIPVSVNYQKALGSLSELAAKQTVPYRIDGAFGIMGMDVPFKNQGELNLPGLPKVALKQLDIENLSWRGADLKIIMEVANPNSFALDMAGLNYGVNLGGNRFAEGVYEKIPSVPANGTSTIDIPLSVDFMKLGRSAYSLLKENASQYELDGEMIFNLPKMGEKRLPFHKTGQIPVVR